MARIEWNPQEKQKGFRNDYESHRRTEEFLRLLKRGERTDGMRVKPLKGSLDKRVRTGRVSQGLRAVLIELTPAGGEEQYIYLGTFNHDDGNRFALTVSAERNPATGIAEIVTLDPEANRGGRGHVSPNWDQDSLLAQEPTDKEPILVQQRIRAEDLEELGFPEKVVAAAMEATTDNGILRIGSMVSKWQEAVLVELATGTPLAEVRTSLALEQADLFEAAGEEEDEDTALARALEHPASRMEFTWIQDDDALRDVIEQGDFAKWKVFLHPEQRQYALKPMKGSFYLDGGAGTGKTVVLLHRTHYLAHRDPESRIVLTTFNKTLASRLEDELLSLDANIPMAGDYGKPGVKVTGLDSLITRLAGKATGAEKTAALAKVLGKRSEKIMGLTRDRVWDTAIAAVPDLPQKAASASFLGDEYDQVILPAQITTEEDYLAANRTGRGVPLTQKERSIVWKVIEAFRAASSDAGSTTFEERAAFVAEYLDQRAAAGKGRIADHVLVDEGQDLTPCRLKVVRALVADGPDDLIIAGDAQQQVYGRPIVMSRYGVEIRGRSRRLRLNYRTTMENLHYALGALSGVEFTDPDGEATDSTGYHSVRSGPSPRIIIENTKARRYDHAEQILNAWLEDGADATGEDGDGDGAPEPAGEGAFTQPIGVFVSSNRKAEDFTEEMDERGIPVGWVTGDPSTAAVQVMTMARAKGLEFSKVIIFDADPMKWPDTRRLLKGIPKEDEEEFRLKSRSQVYVAATRARDELVVIA